MKVVAFVPLRLNSKRVVRKNLKNIQSTPLMKYILTTLSKVSNIDEVYVYCSDESIKEYLPKSVKFLKRSKVLDGDFVKGLDIYKAFVNEVDADYYVLAHATSPFLKVATFQNAVSSLLTTDHDSAHTVREIKTFCWYNNTPLNYELNDIPRTQDIEPVFEETSGFYMFSRKLLTDNSRRIGNNPFLVKVDMIEGIDIDTPEDFELANVLAKHYNLEKEILND